MFGAYKNAIHQDLTPRKTGAFRIKDLKPNISFEDYARNIGQIRQHIENGDVYQITYCVKYKFDLHGDPYALYKELYRRQPVPYPAYIDAGTFQILSLSPERFIKKDSGHILTEPMKGTWHRGNNVISDAIEKRKFFHDVKNRAENIMIADLLRNDLGRIGSDIAWRDLFKVTAYKTLFQMTSTVTAKVPQDIKLSRLMSALFPSGSVTGAPKIRAMEIIREIEKEERNVYTGAIGYISPDGGMYFNVPIRTILVRDKKCEMGIGGGIIWDSTPEGEWAETRLKAEFISQL
jgi:para-aminobenzoate synthetase / 4-amino-4-deoxychorismate lyase